MCRVEPWDRGHGQQNEYENPGVVSQGGRLLDARLRGSKFYLYSVERGSGSDMTPTGMAAEVANDFVVSTLGRNSDRPQRTFFSVISLDADAKLRLVVECRMLRP